MIRSFPKQGEFRDLTNYPGYRVSSDGTVWSCWRKKGLGIGRGTTHVISDQWHRLSAKPRKDDGYRAVFLKSGSRLVCKYVHNLVLEGFHGPCPPGMEGCHKNGIPSDCRIDNLEWGSRSKNYDDARRHGTNPHGSTHGMAILGEIDIPQILDLRASGVSCKDIASNLTVSRQTISAIVSGRTWTHITLAQPKAGRVIKKGAAYTAWKMHVHILDRWTCLLCRRSNVGLTIHHLIKRSHLRLDTDENAMSLCIRCHDLVEAHKVVVTWIDAKARTIQVIDRRDIR